MKDLKLALFEETLYTFNRWLELKEDIGEFDRLTNLRYGGFRSLYSVIENSGIEEEYQEWKENQK